LFKEIKQFIYKFVICNHGLFSLRLSSWVIARCQLHEYLRPRKMGGFPCW